MHYKLALIGFGNVARSLARLLMRKEESLKMQGITFSFTGISTGSHVLPSTQADSIFKKHWSWLRAEKIFHLYPAHRSKIRWMSLKIAKPM